MLLHARVTAKLIQFGPSPQCELLWMIYIPVELVEVLHDVILVMTRWGRQGIVVLE